MKEKKKKKNGVTDKITFNIIMGVRVSHQSKACDYLFSKLPL